MKRIIISFMAIFFLAGYLSCNSAQNRENQANITDICNRFFIDCHDGTFRNINNEWTANDVLANYQEHNPNKMPSLKDGTWIVDHVPESMGDHIYCNLIQYKIQRISSDSQLQDSKLLGLFFSFRAIGSLPMEDLVDSMRARLIDIYDQGIPPLPDQASALTHKVVDDAKDNPKTKIVKFVETPSITFIIILNNNGELTFVVYFLQF